AAPRIVDLTPVQDQQLGAILMWVGGGTFWLIAFTVVFFIWARQDAAEERRGNHVLVIHAAAHGRRCARQRNPYPSGGGWPEVGRGRVRAGQSSGCPPWPSAWPSRSVPSGTCGPRRSSCPARRSTERRRRSSA